MHDILVKTLERTEHAAQRLSHLMHCAGTRIVLPLLVVLVTIDVTMRYFFNSSLYAATEVGTLLLLVVFFASLPYCTFGRQHVYMELVYVRLKGRSRWLADLLAASVGLVFMIVFVWQAVRGLGEMIRYGDGAELIDLPYWPFALVLVVSGVLVALAFALQLARLALGLSLPVGENLDE